MHRSVWVDKSHAWISCRLDYPDKNCGLLYYTFMNIDGYQFLASETLCLAGKSSATFEGQEVVHILPDTSDIFTQLAEQN